MTIRRNVDLAAANTDYSHFLKAVEDAPENAFIIERKIMEEIGNMVNDLYRNMRRIGVASSACDGLREIEALTFDMLRAENPGKFDDVLMIGRSMDINGWSFATAYGEAFGSLALDVAMNGTPPDIEERWTGTLTLVPAAREA